MIQLTTAFALALTELRRNWTRSLLTSLGVLIGVAAVIAMVGLGRGATRAIEEDLASMGNNLLLVVAGRDRGPQARTSAAPFDASDVRAIAVGVPHLEGVAPVVTRSLGAVANGEEIATSATGSSSDYFRVADWSFRAGRDFTEGEERAGAAVCVVGASVVDELFGQADPLGLSVRLGAAPCTVIGVLEAKGANTMGMEQDNLVVVPLLFAQRRLTGSTAIPVILLSVDQVAHMDAVTLAVDDLLRERRHVTGEDTLDFDIRDTRELASALEGVTSVLTAFLAAVAGVSLLVGGIGIMNIMLVSVTERTREIGVRMAIGALESDVMTQFLVEAMVLSLLGGLAGVAAGIALTVAGAAVLDVPVVVEPAVVAGALVFSAGIGVVFGYWPARRAARLEPIDALRR